MLSVESKKELLKLKEVVVIFADNIEDNIELDELNEIKAAINLVEFQIRAVRSQMLRDEYDNV